MEGDIPPEHRALADHLRSLRVGRGLTLQDVADSCGVSRATLSRIENGEVSPTAETLGRLAAAFALPISHLLAPMEPGFQALVRGDAQSLWRDAKNGFSRRAVSPPNGELKVELIECAIEPHNRIAYDRAPVPGCEHHLLMLSGALCITVDGVQHDLRAGDCLRYRLRQSVVFETHDDAARYIVALA